jgi:hypothetical protein
MPRFYLLAVLGLFVVATPGSMAAPLQPASPKPALPQKPLPFFKLKPGPSDVFLRTATFRITGSGAAFVARPLTVRTATLQLTGTGSSLPAGAAPFPPRNITTPALTLTGAR